MATARSRGTAPSGSRSLSLTHGGELFVGAERGVGDDDVRHRAGLGCEQRTKSRHLRQPAGIEIRAETLGELSLAGPLMRQRQEIDHGAASKTCGKLGDHGREGAGIGRPRKELVAVDQSHAEDKRLGSGTTPCDGVSAS